MASPKQIGYASHLLKCARNENLRVKEILADVIDGNVNRVYDHLEERLKLLTGSEISSVIDLLEHEKPILAIDYINRYYANNLRALT